MLDFTLPIIVVVTVFIVMRLTGRENPIEGLKRKWPMVAAVVVVAIGVGVGLQIGVMRLTAPDVDDIIAADPLLPGILKAYPEQEPAIRERLEHAANRGDSAVQREIRAIGYDIGTTLLPRLIGSASDESVVAFIDVFAANMEVASAQGGSACLSYMTGGADGAQSPTFSAEAQDTANQVVMRILAEGVTGKPKRALDEFTTSSLLTRIVDRAYVLAGDRPLDFDAYADLAAIRDEEVKLHVCWTALYLHRAIRELPTADAAALYRTMMAAS
jgi:hypothetical protein